MGALVALDLTESVLEAGSVLAVATPINLKFSIPPRVRIPSQPPRLSAYGTEHCVVLGVFRPGWASLRDGEVSLPGTYGCENYRVTIYIMGKQLVSQSWTKVTGKKMANLGCLAGSVPY